MNLARLSLVALLLGILFVASPASALCVKCISVECWAKVDATARDCSSYGTACATIGYCDSGDCGEFSCGPDQQFAGSARPLAMDYLLTDVHVVAAKTPAAAVAQVTTQTRTERGQ